MARSLRFIKYTLLCTAISLTVSGCSSGGSVRELPANLLPVANLTADVTSGDRPLAVKFSAAGSTDPDGSIVEYAWDCDGDGVYEALSDNPSCNYKYTAIGAFEAKIRIVDNDGGRSTAFVTITVSNPGGAPGNTPPSANLAADPTSGQVPLTISFDASGSSDPDGSIVIYEWDFNGNGLFDGYGDAPTIEHVYTAPGQYNAKVRVTDNDNATGMAAVIITVNSPTNELPTANIVADPTSGIIPFGVSFDAGDSSDPDGSIVMYEWDFDGNGLFDGYDEVPTISHIYTVPGEYAAQVRVTDDNEATGLAIVMISAIAPPNELPVAEFSAAPLEGDAPLTVLIDASGSYDPDGSITMYEWDYDGDGIYDGYGFLPIVEHRYETFGTFNLELRVTDNDWATHTTSAIVTVHGWAKLDLKKSVTNNSISLQVVAGTPAMIFGATDGSFHGLFYARSTTELGTGNEDWQRVRLLEVQRSNNDGELGHISGKPMIAYSYCDTSQQSGELIFSRSNTTTGSEATDWWITTVDDSLYREDTCVSMAVAAGRPAISYMATTAVDPVFRGELKYAFAAVGLGINPSDWQIVTVDDTIGDSLGVAMAVVEGNPAICYVDGNEQALKYARSTTNTGADASDWEISTIASLGGIYSGVAMTIVAGNPAVTYFDNSSAQVMYNRSLSNTGANFEDWTQPISLDEIDTTSYRSLSLAVVNGTPAISYEGFTGVMFAQATTSTGVNRDDWEIVQVDYSTVGFRRTMLAQINSRPAILWSGAVLTYALSF